MRLREARDVAGLGAFLVAALVVFLAGAFYALLYNEDLGTGNFPLAPACVQADSGCAGWTAPAGVGGWAPWFAVQVAMLAVMVLAVATGAWLWRRRPLRESRRVAFEPRRLTVALLLAVALAALLDLGVYLRFWYLWTGLPEDGRAGPDRGLGSAVAEGLAAAIPIATAAVWVAVVLARRTLLAVPQRKAKGHDGSRSARANAVPMVTAGAAACGAVLAIIVLVAAWVDGFEGLGVRCRVPLHRYDSECPWIPPDRLADWVLALVTLSAVVAAFVVLCSLALVAVRASRGKHPRMPRWFPLLGLAFVSASTAFFALCMLATYRDEIVDWATITARLSGTPFVDPIDQVAEATRVFGGLYFVCLLVAQVLLTWAIARYFRGRRHRTAGAAPTPGSLERA